VSASGRGRSGDPGDPVDVRGARLETSALLERLPGVAAWDLTVTDAGRLTPAMRRIRLTAPGLGALDHQPGQDLMLGVPDAEGQVFRRRYTIARLEPATGILDLEMVVHGDGPGAHWAAVAGPGDRLEAIGPRGRVTLDPGADAHLFFADESGIPATFALLAALAPGAQAAAFLEVAGPEERREPTVGAGATVEVTWLERGGDPPGTSGLLVEAAADRVVPGERPHAYLAAELRVVAAARAALAGRGLAPERLSAKPYWRLGVANAAHGEPTGD